MEDKVTNNGDNGAGTLHAVNLEAMPSSDVSFKDTWLERARVLWDRRRTLLRAAAIGLAAGLALAFLIPKRYEAWVRIMPPESHSGTAQILAALAGGRNLSGGLSSLAETVFGVHNTSAMFVDLVESRTIEEHLVERFELQKVYRKRYRQDARKKLASYTDVTQDHKSGIITIAVTDTNKQRARDMAQAYVDELDRLLASVNTSSARRERIFIEQRLQGVKQDLETAQEELSDFSSKNATFDMRDQTRAMVESGAMLQAQLIMARSELQSLEQIYGAENVRVTAVRAKIGELQRQMQKFGGNAGTSASPAGAAGDTSELYPPLRQLPLLGVRYANLYRQLRVQEALFELLTQQYELARIEEAKSIPTVRVVDPPILPEKKSFPPRILITIGCFLLSVGATSAWLLFQNRWQLTDAQDPRKAFVKEVSGTAMHRVRIILRRESQSFDKAA